MSISGSGFSDASVFAAPPADLSQRALKRQAETADPLSKISAMRPPGHSAAVAAAIEKQGRALRSLP